MNGTRVGHMTVVGWACGSSSKVGAQPHEALCVFPGSTSLQMKVNTELSKRKESDYGNSALSPL